MNKYRIVKLPNGMFRIQTTRTDVSIEDRHYVWQSHETYYAATLERDSLIIKESNEYEGDDFEIVK